MMITLDIVHGLFSNKNYNKKINRDSIINRGQVEN